MPPIHFTPPTPAPRDAILTHHASLFPNARCLPFDSFNNRFANQTCYIIGRGPTTFDYAQLHNIPHPLFFINDAICLEKNLHNPHTFFFAHDHQMRIWLNGQTNATAVLPASEKLFPPSLTTPLLHAAPLVLYHFQTQDREALLALARNQLAREKELYTHSGTIQSLLHFAWFAGFKKLNFIGCDGLPPKTPLSLGPSLPTAYDPRLQNTSNSSPSIHYPIIKTVQDHLCQFFNFQTHYLGTPK